MQIDQIPFCRRKHEAFYGVCGLRSNYWLLHTAYEYGLLLVLWLYEVKERDPGQGQPREV